MEQAVARLFAETFGHPPLEILRIPADGSQRTYLRLTGAPAATGGARVAEAGQAGAGASAATGTVIGGIGPDAEENRAFLAFSRAFRSIGLPVPQIFAADERAGVWLMEDLGDTTLFDALSAARAGGSAFPASMLPVYERVVETLPRFQIEGGRVVDYAYAYPRPAFDLQSMRWDLNYFKYHFLKLAHIPFSEQRLENDFDRLAAFLLEADTQHFLYRDFQSRNIMLRDGEPWFIDYQGGRQGAPQYDIASLLYDAKAAIPDDVRAHLLDRYLNALSRYIAFDRERFLALYRGYVLIRIMQAMGAYGYRGFFERKPRFLESVPHAAANIAGLLETGLPVELPELERVFERIAEAWADRPGPVAPLPGLTVHIASFSYRQGLPLDDTGHGGGFVFDCRSLPNPGRHAAYAGATGRDSSVIEFIEAAPETAAFWTHVVALVDAHIASYQARGFSDLTVAFGCTGGQHRSVYFAERLARHVRERFPRVGIRLEHRERKRWPAAPTLATAAEAASAAAAGDGATHGAPRTAEATRAAAGTAPDATEASSRRTWTR